MSAGLGLVGAVERPDEDAPKVNGLDEGLLNCSTMLLFRGLLDGKSCLSKSGLGAGAPAWTPFTRAFPNIWSRFGMSICVRREVWLRLLRLRGDNLRGRTRDVAALIQGLVRDKY